MLTSKLERYLPKRRKGVRLIVVLLLVYAIIGFFILPPIVRAVAVKQLSKELDRQVSIRKVRINPFTLSTSIRGLLINDRDGEPFVSWDDVYVNFQLSSFLGHAWVFKEVRVAQPFVRVQLNRDGTVNFSDLIEKSSTNAPSKPSRPLALRIDHLGITGATAALSDYTPRTPFKRIVGPVDVALDNFQTDPDNRNPYAFSGTTDAGEKFAWRGFFYLDPVRSRGEFTLENLALAKYASLYQDLIQFDVKDGVVGVKAAYQFELEASNRVAMITNASFSLRSFRLAPRGSDVDVFKLRELAVTGASVDTAARRAEVGAVTVDGGRLFLKRDTNAAINVVELSKPPLGAGEPPASILLLQRAVTNAVALLLYGDNPWSAALHAVNVRDCDLRLEDLANPRPARLDLDDVTLQARDLSNQAGSNMMASLSLRWNTNGLIQTDVTASLLPTHLGVQLALTNIDLGGLDPYLQPRLNVRIPSSRLGLNGRVEMRTDQHALPLITFRGDVRLDDFSTVDGVLGEDLLKWGSLRFSGIDANLEPPAVSVREIALDDASARLVIETNHAINLLTALRPNAPPVAASGGTGESGGAPAAPAPGGGGGATGGLPKIEIGSVVISNAQARFTDRSLTPNANLLITQADASISGIASDAPRRADVTFHARVNDTGTVQVTGAVSPFDNQLTNQAKLTINGVDLTAFSPYAGKFAGYRIAKGNLAVAVDCKVMNRKLSSANLITLDQFTFGDKVDSPDATKLPVRLAVAIMKDRNGRIELDVPVEGNLGDPAFRLRKVIGSALLNILTKAATSPFSLLGSLFGGKGEDIRYQDFAPGQADLLAADRDKLDVLVKGLYERPGLQLEIQGSVDPALDREGLQRVMLERKLRTEKWESLRESARAATPPDQVTLAPDERGNLVQKLYREALAQGRIDLSATNSNALPERVAASPSSALAGQKAATVMMRSMEGPPPPAVTPVAGGTNRVAQGMSDIEWALARSMAVGDADFQALAIRRAKVVRAYILQTGKVEPQRIFLAKEQGGSVRTDGARAYLQLK